MSRLRHVTIIAMTLLTWARSAQAECPPKYSVEVIHGPFCNELFGNANVYVTGLNNSGTVCGFIQCPAADNEHAFTWSSETGLVLLDFPSGVFDSEAFGITDAGAVAGTLNGGIAFLLEGETLHLFEPPRGGDFTDAAAVNESNVVVGRWGHSVTGPAPLAFRWQEGVLQDISVDLSPPRSAAIDVSNNGLITGWMAQTVFPPDYRAFIWDNGKVTDLGLPFSEAFATEGRAINSKGQVAGAWWLPSTAPPFWTIRGFFYDGEDFIELGTLIDLPNVAVNVMDMDEAGTIVGIVGGGLPFIWRNGVMRSLEPFILPHPELGQFQGPTAINDVGQIIGLGFAPPDPGLTQVGVLLTPIAPRVGDLTCDDSVDYDDALALISAWGVCEGGATCDEDLNSDGIVNVPDLIVLILNWG